MCRTFRSFSNVIICAFLVAGGVLFSSHYGFSSETEQDKRQIGPTKTMEVTLQKKMSRSLLSKELDMVRVTRYTEYFDKSGGKIPYELLPVPCRAVLVYEPEPKGNPEAVSVTVKERLPGASTAIMVVPN